jgi:Disintegrin.
MLARILLVTMLASAALSQRCADGGCCDVKTGALRAKGTPCQTNPCYLMNSCTGDNPYCPTGGVMRVLASCYCIDLLSFSSSFSFSLNYCILWFDFDNHIISYPFPFMSCNSLSHFFHHYQYLQFSNHHHR